MRNDALLLRPSLNVKFKTLQRAEGGKRQMMHPIRRRKKEFINEKNPTQTLT